MLNSARRYFEDNGVLEVSTPSLVATSVTDPAIDGIRVSMNAGLAWLHTSPEYGMKRLLAAGYPDIYQIGPVFRDGEAGRHHLPEFTMIEWYRLDFGLPEIIDDTLTLATRLLSRLSLDESLIVDYVDLFRERMAIDPVSATSAEIAGTLGADEDLKVSIGDDRDSWLDLAMATRISSEFDRGRLTVVRHYPASQAALARTWPADPRVADRFEGYLGPVELANGFVELTDPDEQEERFENDRKKRSQNGKPDVPIDAAFIDALRSGLPDCAGVAFGLDRALMIAEGRDNIRDVTAFTPGPLQ